MYCQKNCPNMWTHKAKCSIDWLWIRDLMKFKLLNTLLSSIELITWIMATFANFMYFEMLWNKMVGLMSILHILIKGQLIVWWGSKATLALLFMVVLNMDFYIFKVDAHNISIIIKINNPRFLWGTK